MTLPATWRLGIACIAFAAVTGVALAASPAEAAPLTANSGLHRVGDDVTPLLLVGPITASLLVLGSGLVVGSRQRRITESGDES
jgi:hypothetical protein